MNTQTAARRQPRDSKGRFGHKALAEMIHRPLRASDPAPADVAQHRHRAVLSLRERVRNWGKGSGVLPRRRWWMPRGRITPADEVVRAARKLRPDLGDTLRGDPETGRYSDQDAAALAIVAFQEGAGPIKDLCSRGDLAAVRRAAASVILGYTPRAGRDDFDRIGDAMGRVGFLPNEGNGTGASQISRQQAVARWDQSTAAAEAVAKEIAALHGAQATHDGAVIHWTSEDGRKHEVAAPISPAHMPGILDTLSGDQSASVADFRASSARENYLADASRP